MKVVNEATVVDFMLIFNFNVVVLLDFEVGVDLFDILFCRVDPLRGSHL